MSNSKKLGAQAQIICELSPELELELQNPPAPPEDPCFDKEYVSNNCIPIYVRVNIHFILDDNCEGNIATVAGLPGDLSPNNAFKIAEQMVNDANDFYEVVNAGQNTQWNQAEHGAAVTTHQCVPFRYVLTGVYFHCNTNAQTTGINFIKFAGFYVNNDSEINIFVSSVDGGPNGFASYTGKRVVVENFDNGLFNHEVGHTFSLRHTFESDDFCDDTWPFSWTWDIECDGVVDKSGNGCWGTGVDYLEGGLVPCDPQLFCNTHPCCEWANQNNNVMCYSKWALNKTYATLTPCQIDLSLNELSGQMCEYIEVITEDCPPPYANIGVVPNDGQTNNDCIFCVHLEASMSDKYYEIEIYEDDGSGNYSLVAETGQVDGPVGKYCVFLQENYLDKNWHGGVQPDHTYLFTLTVENDCGDVHQHSETIYIPPARPECSPYQSEIDVAPYPNPTSGMLNIDYTVYQSGELHLYLIEAFTSSRIELLHSPNVQAGSYNTSVNLSTYNNGYFYLVYRLDEDLRIETVLKI